MATILIQVAGAPFDEGNIFRVPAIDGGPFVNPYPLAPQSTVDGGVFSQVPTQSVLVDGGTIPLAGTATYDPNKIYGPDDVLTLEFDLEDF
jgi:hypothetical protein